LNLLKEGRTGNFKFKLLFASVPDPIHRIHLFLGLPDPDPDPLVRGMDPDPSIIMQNNKKNLESHYFVTLFDILSLENNVNVPSKSTVTSRKNCVKKFVFCWHLEGQ
jgi:hypothetical protein